MVAIARKAEEEVRSREEEIALIERAIQRDKFAFEDLIEPLRPRVFRHIFYLVDNVDTTRDLEAQTLEKVWRSIHKYQERGAPFIAFMLRVAHNLTISHLRTSQANNKRYARLEDPDNPIYGDLRRQTRGNSSSTSLRKYLVDDDRFVDPSGSLIREESERDVREAIKQLTPDQQEFVRLSYFEDLDYITVAQTMGKSVSAVRVIHFRAIAKLRKVLVEANQEFGPN